MAINPNNRVALIMPDNSIRIYPSLPRRWARTYPYHAAPDRWHADGWRELVPYAGPPESYESYGAPEYALDGDVVRETYQERTIAEGQAEWEASEEYAYRAGLAQKFARLGQIVTAAGVAVQNEEQVFADMGTWARADGLEAMQDVMEAHAIWLSLKNALNYDANLILYGTKQLSFARNTDAVVDVPPPPPEPLGPPVP